MKKAFRSVLAFMLVFVIMASVFCTAGVFAASDTVYTAHLHGTGNATLATEEISVGTETTYTVSFLWKSVQGNARVRLSGSAVGSKNVDLIVDGSYPMPGINYNWQTGRVTYTFTANGDALFFSALQYSAEETEFYIGDVKIFESDANGAAVEDGEVIDLSFVNGAYAWTAPDAAYIDYAEQETGFFALESDPNDGVEKLIVFKMPYVFPDAWDARSFNKEVSVDTSKTYTFKMYYKSLSTDNNKADIVVNNTKIVEDGGYNVKNGAVYDGYTGLISYTFKPSNSSIYINMESRKSPPDANNLKDWAIALPQLFESDENGNAESGPLYLGKYTVREIKAPYGMVFDSTPETVELTYAGETVEVTETAIELYNQRQKAEVSLFKTLDKDEIFNIGNNGEILSVQFGLYAAEEMTAADGSVIPKNGLLETAGCDENGKLTFKTDIPVGARLYVKEIATDEKYILSDEKYPVSFEYAGQETALVKIKANGGEVIKNNILYGSVKGLKIDCETESVIAGAVFGLFRGNETDYMAKNAILTAESDKNGIFTFNNIPFGSLIIKELKPANGYLPNDEIYTVTIDANGQIVEIAVANNRIPEIRTKAAVNGEKTAVAGGEITVEDTVYYNHLIPGREYTVKGILMDRSIGAALLVTGKEITAEITFTPEKAEGEVIVRYTFDGKGIKCQTDIVVFEALYCYGEELAVHADIDDTDQTVTLTVPTAPYTPAPKTGDSSKLGFWIGLAAVALGGVISAGIIRIKSRKDDDE